MSSTHTCPVCGEDYNIKTVHRCSKKKKAKTPTIAALKAALESERKDLCFEYAKDRIGIKFGHEAATERLMPLIAEALAMADKIATAECPKYVAHPQSVWFDEHIQQSARAFQAMVAKLVRNGE